MNHGNLVNQLRLRSWGIALALGVLPAGMLGAVAAVPTEVRAARSAKQVDRARCEVTAVHAKKTGNGKIPDNLSFLSEQLQDDQFAAYKSFRLIDQKQLRLKKGTPEAATLESGHAVKLELLSGDAETLKLQLELGSRSGSKPLVSTAYSIANGGVLLIGGPSYKDGKLLFAVQCAARG